MKQRYVFIAAFFAVSFACVQSIHASHSQSGSIDDAADTIRLNMQAYLADYPLDADGKWVQTYNDYYPSIDFGEYYSFSHMKYFLYGGNPSTVDMTYWDGFTLCTNGDDTDWGYSGSSAFWTEHQWGCMAGGGIDSLGNLVKGAPYLVGYWGYNYEDEIMRSLQVNFPDGETHRPIGIWVCNHPWAYYGIKHSDGFAHSFADNGAAFKLIVHGMDEEEGEAGMPIEVTLASFHDNALDISKDWQWVNLTSLGQVNGIFFTLESSDMSPGLGMNTAAYFCLGGMEILEHVDELPRPTGLQAEPLDEHSVKVNWTKVGDAAYYRVYVDSVLVDSTAANYFTFTGLKTYTTYRFFAQAVSAYGESSDWGYVSARTKDLTPPTPPTNLQAEPDIYKIRLTWDAGTDNIAVGRYGVYVDGKRYTRTKYTTCTITGLDPATTYQIEVDTWDTSDNTSERVSMQVTTRSIATGTEEAAAEAVERIYTLQGQPVSRKHTAPGQVYIVVTGDKATKQIIRQ